MVSTSLYGGTSDQVLIFSVWRKNKSLTFGDVLKESDRTKPVSNFGLSIIYCFSYGHEKHLWWYVGLLALLYPSIHFAPLTFSDSVCFLLCVGYFLFLLSLYDSHWRVDVRRKLQMLQDFHNAGICSGLFLGVVLGWLWHHYTSWWRYGAFLHSLSVCVGKSGGGDEGQSFESEEPVMTREKLGWCGWGRV